MATSLKRHAAKTTSIHKRPNLKAEALKKINSLTSKLWTTYNMHDPGITILEALCYTFTDAALASKGGLVKINLSIVISKYIGDTEKNLSKIFSAASSMNSILLFDEADALFGKRSDVKDAHDKYASQEVSYLLAGIKKYKRKALFRFRDGSILTSEALKRFNLIYRQYTA